MPYVLNSSLGVLHIFIVFLWILKPVQLNEDAVEDYIECIDSILSDNLPSEKEDPLLHKLVKAFQVHWHSKTCHKYKNKPCRFHYERYFTDRTILAKPLRNVRE